jgi:hypothetical protein
MKCKNSEKNYSYFGNPNLCFSMGYEVLNLPSLGVVLNIISNSTLYDVYSLNEFFKNDEIICKLLIY